MNSALVVPILIPLVGYVVLLIIHTLYLDYRIEKLERHVHSADELLGTTNGPQEPSAQP